jgi:hypothetical protein
MPYDFWEVSKEKAIFAVTSFLDDPYSAVFKQLISRILENIFNSSYNIQFLTKNLVKQAI